MLKLLVKYPHRLVKNFFQTISKSKIAAWFRCEPRYKFSEDSTQFFSYFKIGDVLCYRLSLKEFYRVKKIVYHSYDTDENVIILSPLHDHTKQFFNDEWFVLRFYEKIDEPKQIECIQIKELQIKNGELL